MTTPRYPTGCTAGSQERGDASPVASNPDYAWIVNFNNGNVNNNHRDNNAWVRAVRGPRASECQGATEVRLHDLYQAWQRARRRKAPSHDQVRFELGLIDELLDLQQRLQAGTWIPSPSTCFVARKPKAREIHAPAFADRVVHHWLVPIIESIYEPTFIHDSYSNRRGKGTLAAVHRLHSFARQVDSGQGGGWYLQLDIANYFNSIDRQVLWPMLRRRLRRAGIAAPQLAATHALLRQSIRTTGVRHRSTAQERALIPPHKRLENAPAGRGIPIGNLSSQFFANVYLDALDQFAKHTLKAKRYIRYVDDFVLVHHDRGQLVEWQQQIVAFLRSTLHLELKADIKLRPLSDGIDFLGYVIRPSHLTVRRRVVAHARAALADWERQHIRSGTLTATPAELRGITAVWRSYQGHFAHAAAHRLQQGIKGRYGWIDTATRRGRRFDVSLEHRAIAIRVPR